MPNLMPSYALNYEYLDKLHIYLNYNNYHPKYIASRRFENIEVSDNSLVFRLRDKKQLDILSLVVLEMRSYHNKTFYEVKYTKSVISNRHYLSYLFELIVFEFHYMLLSDSTHTSPGSKEFWLSLGRQKKYKLLIYNVKTNYFRDYKNYPISKIWGIETDIQDNESKQFFIEDLYDRKKISTDIYKFLTENITEIEDRSDVRLYLKMK